MSTRDLQGGSRGHLDLTDGLTPEFRGWLDWTRWQGPIRLEDEISAEKLDHNKTAQELGTDHTRRSMLL